MLANGTTPVYFLDDYAPNPMGELPEEAEESGTRRTKVRILVVDDHRLVADSSSKILQRAGYDVRTAYDGWSAIDIVKEFEPDYLLTDVLMPGMDGVELAITVSKMMAAPRIVLFSGNAGTAEILHSAKERGYDFELLAKPVHPTSLVEHFRKKHN